MERKNNKPNILLIVTDQQRIDTLGFLNDKCHTPNLDKLASMGTSFNKCITPSPLCTPARASLFTGLYPHQVKGIKPEVLDPKVMTIDDEITRTSTTMLTNNFTMDIEKTFPNLLKQAGYETNYAGKWHLGNSIIEDWWDRATGYDTSVYTKWCDDKGLEDGWAFNDHDVRSKIDPFMSNPTTKIQNISPEDHGDAWIVDKAIDYIQTRDEEKPFFTVCAINGPHPPFKIPEPYYSMFDKNDVEMPPNFNHLENKPDYVSKCYYHQVVEEFGTDFDKWKKSVAVYRGFVKMIDDQVGRLIDSLKEEGVYDDTLIVFTSDHGEMLGSHGLWHKMAPYEEALRVPMIYSAPFIRPNILSNDTTSLADIVPTVLSFAGIDKLPDELVGLSLKDNLTKGDSLDNRLLFSEHRPLGEFHKAVSWRLVTDNKYKYVFNDGDKDELYDLVRDPYELKNLIDDDGLKETLNYYRVELKKIMMDTDDEIKNNLILERV